MIGVYELLVNAFVRESTDIRLKVRWHDLASAIGAAILEGRYIYHILVSH